MSIRTYIHNIALRSIALHYTTLHYITLRYVTLRYVTLHTYKYIYIIYTYIYIYIHINNLNWSNSHTENICKHLGSDPSVEGEQSETKSSRERCVQVWQQLWWCIFLCIGICTCVFVRILYIYTVYICKYGRCRCISTILGYLHLQMQLEIINGGVSSIFTGLQARKSHFPPNSVSTLRGSYGRCKGGCLIRLLTLGPGISTVQART